MKHHASNMQRALEKGLTLVEISLVIALMLVLASIATFSVANMTEWKQAREAGESLRSVYLAQKSYLADHPSDDVDDLEDSDLIPYLPNGLDEMPSVQSKDDADLDIDVTVMPPVFMLGTSSYDPSDSTSDSLWDVGSL